MSRQDRQDRGKLNRGNFLIEIEKVRITELKGAGEEINVPLHRLAPTSAVFLVKPYKERRPRVTRTIITRPDFNICSLIDLFAKAILFIFDVATLSHFIGRSEQRLDRSIGPRCLTRKSIITYDETEIFLYIFTNTVRSWSNLCFDPSFSRLTSPEKQIHSTSKDLRQDWG